MNFSAEMTKIAEQIKHEIAQRSVERAIIAQFQTDLIDAGMFASFPGFLYAKPAGQSAQDAAACRAVGIRPMKSDGRPSFFIPDLGE